MQGLGLAWMLGALLWVFPVVYIVLRWRSYREAGPADPQLGLKVLLFYFRMIAFDVLLVAAGCAIFALLSPADRKPVLRIVAALAVSGGLIWSAHLMIIERWTNSATFPLVARTFNGINVAVTGVAGTVTLVSFSVLMFQAEPGGSALKGVLSALLVAVPAWLHQTVKLARQT